MNHPAEAGGGYSGGQHAEYDFEMIRRLAHSKGAVWTEHAKTSHKKVTSTGLSADSFSDIPACQTFGQVYEAAYDIYVATLEGVQKDVATYQRNLLKVAEHMERRDHRAQSVFAGFGSDGGTLEENRKYTHANHSDEATRAHHRQQALEQEALRQQQAGTGNPPSAGTPDSSGAAAVTDSPATVTPAASTGSNGDQHDVKVNAGQDPYASDKPTG
ncbi:hypothetical protein [Oryzihumus sp.]|uniref:hypothetical protein n=1 Tax=Oryzihumus sp. TaxID=1968903 RepID=UPI002ED77726